MAAVSFYKQSLENLKTLSDERSHIQELAARAERDPDGTSEELEAAMEKFKRRTGSDVVLNPESDTELALTSTLIPDTPDSRPNRKTLAYATPENVAASAKQLFARPRTPQSEKKPKSGRPHIRPLSPEQRHDHEVSMKARSPFRIPLY
jgi:hypothetical protein